MSQLSLEDICLSFCRDTALEILALRQQGGGFLPCLTTKILRIYSSRFNWYINKMQWAVTTPLYNIGEHVYYLSDEYKTAHTEIDWHLISGLRHRLVHDYDDTSWEIISEIVFDDIPILIEQLKAIVENEGN